MYPVFFQHGDTCLPDPVNERQRHEVGIRKCTPKQNQMQYKQVPILTFLYSKLILRLILSAPNIIGTIDEHERKGLLDSSRAFFPGRMHQNRLQEPLLRFLSLVLFNPFLYLHPAFAHSGDPKLLSSFSCFLDFKPHNSPVRWAKQRESNRPRVSHKGP